MINIRLHVLKCCSSIMTQQGSSAITVPALTTLCTHTHTHTSLCVSSTATACFGNEHWTFRYHSMTHRFHFSSLADVSVVFVTSIFRADPSLTKLPKTEAASSMVTPAIYLRADSCRIQCSSALLSPDPHRHPPYLRFQT